MIYLRLLLIGLIACVISFPAIAQDDDKGFITRTLESSLAGEGREVRINGFRGALSRQAQVDSIVILDDDGVWLTMSDLILQLNRRALLRGRIEIEELSAKKIELERLPKAPESDLPPAQAEGFSLPELPVSIDIKSLRADQIILGKSILGERAELTLNAALSLINGEAVAQLDAERTDGTRGQFNINARFVGEGSVVTLDIDLNEGKNGIAARLLGLPDNPSVDLKVQGEGPLDDLTTNLRITTDGTERLRGMVQLTADTPTPENSTAARSFKADISGDITALFAPQYRPFFGENVALKVQGRRGAEGILDISELVLGTDALQLSGNVTLNKEFWPVVLDLNGRIANKTDTPVTLPISGDATRLKNADLDVQFDQAAGDKLTAKITLNDFERSGITVKQTLLTAQGDLKGQLNSSKQIGLNLDLDITDLTFPDDALNSAVGSNVNAKVRLDFAEGQPLRLSEIDLDGEDYKAKGDVEIAGLSGGLDTVFDIILQASDLSRFSAIANRNLSGAIDSTVKGSANLGGQFEVVLDGVGTDLKADQVQADKLLRGQTKLTLKANRNSIGTRIETLDLRNDHLSAKIAGLLTNDGADLTFAAKLTETKELVDALKGAATVEGSAQQRDGNWNVDLSATGPFGATATIDGLATGPDMRVEFEANLPNVKPLVSQYNGAVSLAGVAFQTTDGIRVDTKFEGPYNLTGDIAAQVTGENTPSANFDVRLPDVSPLVANVSGPLAITGSVDPAGTDLWRINTDINGPAGTSAKAAGTTSSSGTLNLTLTGTAPLALANPFITPRSLAGTTNFDLAINGSPELSSVSGTITTAAARLSVPSLRVALNNINARVALSAGRANIDLTADVSSGGQLRVSGPVGLTGQMPANLRIFLNSVGIEDPTLYKTSVDGEIGVDGSLLSNARISGLINVGKTEVTIPSSGISSFGTIPPITHINAPQDVRRTLARAGLNDSGKPTGIGSNGPAYPLDLTISAPQQIFVRGRGLEAELGGQLRLTGTTNNIISSGRFELVRGKLDILEKRFDLDEGSIQLQGDFDPFIRFVAITTTSSGTASVIVDGSASSPEVRFESSPEAPQDEVLAQIFFGRDVTQLSALQALQLANAVATLAGRGGEGVISKLRRGFDLDDLDITTDEEGNAGLRAGKYISDNIYTDVTVGSQNNAEVSLNIDLTPTITARGKLGSDGETSLGIFFEKDY